ncbi:hypothetical protein P3T36_003337 [Kitasatospora sp. MAP12-15]|uniref:hypothetical protein n=1 Tax=unclassified Kitasatospora TaxID=2633591 RepID=UPI0024764B73|nr:hypothetical protein [Kitasatospora sp. MAP12-44]MDH6111313.1 hypothetical protein [Kitasatospora sp. MAP12-44]
MSLDVTIAHLPELGTIVAEPGDRRSAYWLEQAGLVRDDRLKLHRIRRDTDDSTAERQINDARRLLAAAGYGLTRVYSTVEQRRRVESRPPWVEAGPPQAIWSRTAWVHLVSADVANGHLVLHAHHQGHFGEIELLGSYPASGDSATFYTEGGGAYGISRHPNLDSARAEWAAFGYASTPPVPGSPRRAAARTVSSRSTQVALAAEQPASALPAPARPVSYSRAPF